MLRGVSFKSSERNKNEFVIEIPSAIPTDDVTQADPDELLDGLSIEFLCEVDFVFELQRQQVHQERHKLLLAHKVALVALAENFVNDVLDDGGLRREKKLVVDLGSPHCKRRCNFDLCFG